MAWHAKESVRELYTDNDAEIALAFIDELVTDTDDQDMLIAVRSIWSRTLNRWRLQITAWHTAHVTNEPTEAVNTLIKRVNRAAFGFTSFRNNRIRSLLYAGKPNLSLLATITPRQNPMSRLFSEGSAVPEMPRHHRVGAAGLEPTTSAV
jgi:transposase